MANSKRLSVRELNTVFINSLSEYVISHSAIDKKPLEIDIQMPYGVLKLRVYLYNCTNPPGGRAADEYKSQIMVPGQKKGEKGNFDYSGERIVLFCAYVQYGGTKETGVFILYDPMCHTDFSFSSNVQVKSSMIAPAFANDYCESSKTNGEIIITAIEKNLIKGIQRRIEVVSPAIER